VTRDTFHQGLDLDGLDSGSGGVFGGSAAWGGWGNSAGAGTGRSASAVSGASVAFPGLDAHGLGSAALGAWSVNSQGMSAFGNVPSMNSLPPAAAGMNQALGKKKSPKLQGADAVPSFPPTTQALPQSFPAQTAAKPPASFAQVAGEKPKVPVAAPKAAAPASSQQHAFKTSAGAAAAPASAAAASNGAGGGAQASGQAVLRMRGLP
jgi:hypothetical protein